MSCGSTAYPRVEVLTLNSFIVVYLGITIWYDIPFVNVRAFKKLIDAQVALDYIPEVGLNWIGNVNELNAGTRTGVIYRV